MAGAWSPTRVSLGYGDRTVVDGLSFAVPDGRVTAVVGANACGKSTLLRGMARLLRPTSGAVLLDGEQIHRASTRQVARTLGLLPQAPVTPGGRQRRRPGLAAAGTRTTERCAAGARRTTPPWPRRWR